MISLDIINLIANLALKPMVILGLTIMVVRSSSVRSATINHGMLISGLYCCGTSIVISFIISAYSIELIPEKYTYFTEFNILHLFNSKSHWVLLGFSAYLTIALSFILYNIFAILSVIQLTQKSEIIDSEKLQRLSQKLCEKIHLNKTITFYSTSQHYSPSAWGIRHAKVLLPDDYNSWGDKRLERVLLHEYAHIKRFDWLTKISINLICAVFWFILPLWWIRKKVFWYAELACDDLVITTLNCRTEYADDLLDISSQLLMKEKLLVALIERSQLFNRIHAVLDGSRDRSLIAPLKLHSVSFIAFFLILPLSVLHFSVQESHSLPREISIITFMEETEPGMENANTLNNTDKKEKFEKPVKPAFIIVDEHFISPRSEEETIQYAYKDLEPETVRVNTLTTISVSAPEIKISGAVPQKLVTPIYPKKARLKNIEGKVTAQFDIDATGQVNHIRIVSATPEKVFDKAVIRALSKSRFTPMEFNGHPTAIHNMTEVYDFRLIPGTTN